MSASLPPLLIGTTLWPVENMPKSVSISLSAAAGALAARMARHSMLRSFMAVSRMRRGSVPLASTYANRPPRRSRWTASRRQDRNAPATRHPVHGRRPRRGGQATRSRRAPQPPRRRRRGLPDGSAAPAGRGAPACGAPARSRDQWRAAGCAVERGRGRTRPAGDGAHDGQDLPRRGARLAGGAGRDRLPVDRIQPARRSEAGLDALAAPRHGRGADRAGALSTAALFVAGSHARNRALPADPPPFPPPLAPPARRHQPRPRRPQPPDPATLRRAPPVAARAAAAGRAPGDAAAVDAGGAAGCL